VRSTLLEQSVEQHAGRAGRATIEAKDELIQIVVELAWLHRAMMCSQQPALTNEATRCTPGIEACAGEVEPAMTCRSCK
jgi:hypothetical protein